MTDSSAPRLVRAVGLAGLIAIAVNGVVGSGIFVLPATVAALAGKASPAAYVLAALLMALVTTELCPVRDRIVLLWQPADDVVAFVPLSPFGPRAPPTV